MEEADEAKDFARMAQCVRKLGGQQQRSSFTVQPDADEDLNVRTERWAEFGKRKFSPTDRET
eukprot:COSAG05_NODE_302_length_11841_cov_253.738801_2_plen_62_part_00